MKIKRVYGIYFSPGGNTEEICKRAAKEIAFRLNSGCEFIDFTLPEGRKRISEEGVKGARRFGADELAVFGVPAYEGRVPDKILPFIRELFSGADTPCAALVSYGNRSRGYSLKELISVLGEKGFKCFAGASVCASHAFPEKLGEGRPDALDIEKLLAFSGKCAEYIEGNDALPESCIKDPAYLSHKATLEKTYLRPAPSEFYLGGELFFSAHAEDAPEIEKNAVPEAVLFDLDGTLWDPTAAVTSTWNEVFSEKGESLRLERDEVKALMGMRMEEIAEKLFPERDEEERNSLLYECGLREIAYLSERGGELYPKLKETLEKLRSMGLRLGIISNCQEKYIGGFLKVHELGYIFEDYEESGRTGLSKGMNIRLVMDRRGMGNAVYVGDTERDGEAAREAGLCFIHAGYGLGRAEKADAVLSEIAALPDLLKHLYNIE